MPRSPETLAYAAATALAALVVISCTDQPIAPRNLSPNGAARRSEQEGQHTPASVRWNSVALGLVDTYRPKLNQQAALRAMAYLSLAQYNAVVAAQRADDQNANPSPQAAVAGASAVVLTYVFPDAAAFIEAKVSEDRAALSGGSDDPTDFPSGEATGRRVGAQTVASARTDRFDAVWSGTVPVGPGLWSSSLVPPVPPLLPLLGEMRPFFMEAGSQFRPGPPPVFGSPAFLDALSELRQISDTRTEEQKRIGRFWAMATGTLVAGFWNETAQALIASHQLGERDAAHAFAFMNMAAMDANIACHDGKYTYWLIRPTKADPGIELIPQDGDLINVGLPNHPSYPANHACQSGTFAAVLAGFFPSDGKRLLEMGQEAGRSRMYAGLHYRFDVEAGFEIAAKVVHLAHQRDVEEDRPFALR